ncbi:MAG: RluA family pseudouridine synthase [Candidatus Pacebacteria bacterium]|nr:RluA family pseudouridine synthase [Candidatus Paceibacterota bacterium]
MRIKVLYEDTNILAIDKPAGISVQNDEKSTDKTVLDFVVKKYKKAELVHRLDKDTSGVLLIAKNAKTHEFLKQQFQTRTVKKIYHTVVSGFMKEDRGVINKPIGRSPSDFRRRLAGRGARGELREAITEYKVLKRFEEKKNKFTYLEVMPKTGRTHQIRVHMKYASHPVVCDSLYNPTGPCPKSFSRMALHAKSIEFKDLKGKIVKVESPLPKEFKGIV